MKIHLCFLIALLPAMGALAQSAQSTSVSPIELQHVDVTKVDTAVDPCGNFYQYACNKLNAASPIPADQASWGNFDKLQLWNLQVLHGILEKNQGAKPARTANEQKIGDLYAACMNQATSKANDLMAVRPLLARIEAMKQKQEIATVLAALHSSYSRAWESNDDQVAAPMLGYGQQADYNDVGRVVASVDQGGLGMPSRDYYLSNDSAMKSLREKYIALLTALLKMDGASAANASTAAQTILRMETAMAQAQMDNISRRDPNKVNNRFTLETLKGLTPHFDWDAYLKGIGAPAVPLYEVTSPEFFRALDRSIVSEDLANWKLYLRAHLLLDAAPFLGEEWRSARFSFSSALYGEKEQHPDWYRCTRAVDVSVGQALGQVYVAQVFPPESKDRVLRMVTEIESAMGRDLDTVTWMQPATKNEARKKLQAVLNKIGYPDKWIDYSSLTIGRESYPADVARANAFELKRQLAFIGKPLDRSEWIMTPPTVNAYEDPQANTINFPAGILQPGFFDPMADDVINYGSAGSVIGHELTHDFDDQGRKFDMNGNLRDWWLPEDARQYEERGSCIANEYTGPVPGVSGVQQNGKLTQGEDTADNGGIYLALSALAEDLKRQGRTLDDTDVRGLSNLQRFFIAYGSNWCEQLRPETAKEEVLTNPHSLPELRVINVLGNMPEFQKAFHCKSGQPMVHATRCRVW